jgi:N-acetylglucosaminyl-diphospho-decaprenol L-rhamnosyltransferase
MTASVAVVTVAYNTGRELETFLDSLAGAGLEPGSPVVVVDNSPQSRPETRQRAESRGARYLHAAENRGYGGGVSAGVAALDGPVDFLLISNPDVVFAPAAIDELLAGASRHPNGAAFGPRILDASGQVYPSARQLPSLRTGIGHALFSRVWPTNPWTRSYWADRDAELVEREAGWVSGAALLVLKSAYDAIGGFDQGYFMYFEDVDLGARFGQAGWKNVYVPSAVVTHTGALSTSQDSKTMELEHHRSAYRYLARKYSAWYLAPLRLVLRVSLGVRGRWVTRK